MKYGSVCSGIEAATVAWHPLGWEPQWFSEIEPFPCRLLNHYYPSVPNLGDMLKITEDERFTKSTIDVLVGGTPCQSFSIAGLRGGLSDSRGNLALQFCRILAIKRPRWFVWENVPGVHSSFSYEEGSGRMDREGRNNGREFTETADFAAIIAGFQECGYSVSWRVLDAQYFGVPQRRRRVFVVGYLGNDWRPSASVLFEPQGLRGNTPKSRKKGKEVTGTLGRRTGGRSIGAEEAAGNQLIAGTLDASYGRLQGCSGQDACHGHSTLIPIYPINTQAGLRSEKLGEGTGLGIGDDEDPAYTLQKAHHHAVCYPYNQITSCENRSNPQPGDPAGMLSKTDHSPLLLGFQSSQSGVRLVETHATLDANNGPRRHNGITDGHIVRRLTPLECERLQGFLDNYTAIPGAADTPRYEVIGNSMAVPVMAWIGRRIEIVNTTLSN